MIRSGNTAHTLFAISLRRCLGTFFVLVAWTMIVCSSSPAQNIQYTQNVADLAMRSDIHVDPSTLGMTLQIPLRQYPGRGGASLSATLSYSSKIWRINHFDTSTQHGLVRTREQALFAEHSAAGWTSSLDPPTIENTGGSQSYDEFGNPICFDVKCQPPKGRFYISRLHVHMPDGSAHELRKDDIPRQNSPDQTGNYYSVDGSQLRYNYDNSTLYLPDGSRYIFGQTTTQYIDRNGNTLTYNISTRRWTDSLGRLITLPLPQQPISGNVTYTVPGVDGSSIIYIFRWKNLSQVRTDPSQLLRYAGDRTFDIPAQTQSPSLFSSEIFDYICAAGLFDPVVLSEIELPNQRKYTFTYNIWGEIDKVTYPTGGYEKFTYATIPPLSQITGVYNEGNRGVVTRRVSVDGINELSPDWQYSATGSGPYTVSITAPDGTLSERVLYSGNGSTVQYGFDEARAGMASEERVTSGGQIIRRTLTDFTTSGPTPGGWNTATRDPRPVRTIEVLLDYGTNALSRATRFNYDADLNRIKTRQYPFTTVTRTQGLNNTIDQFSNGTLLLTQETTFLVNDELIASTVRDEYRARNMVALPTLSVVKQGTAETRIAETQMRYDESAYPLLTYSSPPPQWIDPSTNYRGNVTTVRRWLNMPDSYIETHIQFDQAGSVRKSYDGLGNIWETEYSSAFGYAYPTLTRTPVPQAGSQALLTSADYDFNTGLVKSTTDPNSKVTSFEYKDPISLVIDPLNRLRRTVRPTGGGSTTYSYSDTPGSLYVRTQTELDGSRSLDAYQFFDGIGRANRSFNWEGSTYVVGDTEYDNLGRVSRVSNPYRTTILNDPSINPLGNWTTNQYDGLGRLKSVTAPASVAVLTDYFGNQVTVTDQAGKKRRSTTDSLGRLTTVDELNGNLTTYAQTTYGYDGLGNLLSVSQATNGRSFTYDSLSRLRSASNPEQVGSTTYDYDANSNLKTKLDPNSITTTYDYDNLNRTKTRTYTGGAISTPQVSYSYDTAINGRGRLASVTAAGVSTYGYTAYDAMGRVTAYNQATTGAGTYNMSATYNLAGLMVDETYPSNKVIHTEYDDAGRVAGVKDAANTAYYAGAVASDSTNRIQYAAHGAMSAMKLGNNLWEKTTFNTRLQPTQIKLGTTSTPSSILQLDYTYGVIAGGNLDATLNNGNVQSQTVTVGSNIIKQSYTYDQVNRLLSAAETYNQAARWTQSYTFDQVGNRTGLSNTGIDVLPTTSTPTISSVTNRISATGYMYDNAGNLKDEPAALNKHYKYDGENRLVDFNTGATKYFYDGDGHRVKKITIGSQTTTTVFVYNAGGQLIAEYTSDPVPPAAGGGGTSYLTTDHLGSTRVVTGTNASQPVKARYDYLPYGEELPSSVGGRSSIVGYGGADSTRQKFTQKERDSESGLDYFGARYCSSPQGRFTSVDPAFESAKRQMPQSWDRYSYCLNNPLVFVDPDGEIWGTYLDKQNQRHYHWYDDQKQLEASGAEAVAQDLVYQINASLWIRLDPRGPNGSGRTEAARNGWDAYASQGQAVERTHGLLGDDSSAARQAFELALANTGGRAVAGLLGRLLGSIFSKTATETIANAVPSNLARAIPGEGTFGTLGPAGAEDVFVTAANDIAGLNARQLAARLAIPESRSFTVFEFPTPRVGLASPINRSNFGFVGFGRTAGGAREFVIPNGPIPASATMRVVK